MVSCVIRGRPQRVADALLRLRANTTILGPAEAAEVLQPADKDKEAAATPGAAAAVDTSGQGGAGPSAGVDAASSGGSGGPHPGAQVRCIYPCDVIVQRHFSMLPVLDEILKCYARADSAQS